MGKIVGFIPEKKPAKGKTPPPRAPKAPEGSKPVANGTENTAK